MVKKQKYIELDDGQKLRISKLVVYNMEWQLLRLRCNFSSESHLEESLRLLEKYVMSAMVIPPKELVSDDVYAVNKFNSYTLTFNRWYRINNLLNATKMGYNGNLKLTKSEMMRKSVLFKIEQVNAFQNRIKSKLDAEMFQPFLEQYKVPLSPTYQMTLEIDEIIKSSTEELEAVLLSLTKRKEFATKVKRRELQKTRPELLWYTDMINGALYARKNIDGGPIVYDR